VPDDGPSPNWQPHPRQSTGITAEVYRQNFSSLDDLFRRGNAPDGNPRAMRRQTLAHRLT
jgi:hypothetical protein